jgi:hypothetical protein
MGHPMNERCGFCISGLVPPKQGEPPKREVCPYCDGSGWQIPGQAEGER